MPNRKIKKTKTQSVPSTDVQLDIPEAKIILDKSFVANYLRAQEEKENDSGNVAQNASIICINVSVIDLESADDSVTFVSEDTASQQEIKLRDSNQKTMELSNKVKRLSIHCNALKGVILNKDKEMGSQQQPSVSSSLQHDSLNDLQADLDISYNESWVKNQLQELAENGQIDEVFGEIDKYFD